MPDSPPKTIGKYQVTDLLGQGAMGVVYRALDPLLGRHVAVKVMSQSIATDEELRNRFMREARAAGSLQHPNIITIYDFGEADGSLYIAMEYVEGSDLSEIMERHDRLPITAKVDIIVDVLHALDYAHQRKVVHRDVKPANIRVSVDGHAKLMDFGIARLEKSDLTRSGMMIGTPDYMAPEQITGEEITPATDVFAVGAVLYELLTGLPTFSGDTLHALIYQVINQQPKPLREVAASVPVALEPIVARALAKDPAQRYPSAAAMALELSAVRTALSGAVTVNVMARRTPLATARMTKPITVAAPKRRRALIWGGVGAGAVALGVIGVLLAGGGAHPSPPAASGPAAPAASAAPTQGAAGQGAAGQSEKAANAEPARTPSERAASESAARSRVSAAAPTPSAPAEAQSRQRAGVQPQSMGGAHGAAASPTPPPAAASGAAQQSGAGGAAPAGQSADAPSKAAPVPAPQPAAPPATAVLAPAPAAPVDPRPQIEALVAEYARAIEARSVPGIRRVYPALTAEQQRNWEQFFGAARSVKAQLAISRLDVNGSAADLTVGGGLDFDAGGGTQRQPMNFHATATLEGGVWKLTSVR